MSEPRTRRRKLFHAVVVVGASLTAGACGADEVVVDAAASGVDNAVAVVDARPPDAPGDARVDAVIIL